MLARLFRQSGVYALAGVVGKLSGVVLTAFYVDTAYLPVADYGYLGTLRAAMMTGLLLAGAGLPLGIIRFGTTSDLPEAERAAVPLTSLLLATATGLATAAAVWLAAPLLAGALALDATRTEPVRWLAVYVALKTISDVSYTDLRRREQAGLYVLASAVEMLILLGGVLTFLVVLREGLVGVMKGYVLSAAVMAAVLTVALLRRVEWRASRALVGPMVAFGLPLIVSGLASRFLYFGDRFVLVHLAGLEATAAYELASQFGTLVHTFLTQGFQLSFTVIGMKAFGEAGTDALYRRTFRHFAALAGGAVLGIGLFASDVARLFATDPAYLAIDGTVLLVAGGFAFNGLYAVTVSMLYAAAKTGTVARSVGVSALLNLGLNVALIPVFGIAGAALATLVAYAVLAVWTSVEAERIVRARYPWRSVAVIVGVVGVLWGAGQLVADAPVLARLGVRGGLVALYLPALLVTGVYGAEDRAAGWAAARRLRERFAPTSGPPPPFPPEEPAEPESASP